MNELLSKLSANNLIDPAGNIILDTKQVVDLETFESFFGAALNEVDQYTALVVADGEKGYTRFFDEWKANGIL